MILLLHTLIHNLFIKTHTHTRNALTRLVPYSPGFQRSFIRRDPQPKPLSLLSARVFFSGAAIIIATTAPSTRYCHHHLAAENNVAAFKARDENEEWGDGGGLANLREMAATSKTPGCTGDLFHGV